MQFLYKNLYNKNIMQFMHMETTSKKITLTLYSHPLKTQAMPFRFLALLQLLSL